MAGNTGLDLPSAIQDVWDPNPNIQSSNVYKSCMIRLHVFRRISIAEVSWLRV